MKPRSVAQNKTAVTAPSMALALEEGRMAAEAARVKRAFLMV